jgi:hypothetical protein
MIWIMTLLLKGEYSLAEIKKIYLGATQVDKLFAGTDLIHEKDPIDTTAPITTVYPDPTISRPAGTEYWLEVNEACTTYYTLDGSTPTTASPIFTEALVINDDVTIKYFSVDTAGNTEAVKTAVINIDEPAAAGWRYLKIEGYGSVEESTTTRMIEVEAWEGATNRMAAATILSHDTINAGATTDIGTIKDTIKTTASGSYPIWWLATPNGNVVADLGASRALTKLNYYGYSASGVQRANRFRILASNTNNGTDWVELWNMSANTTPQPILPSGYELIL